MGLSLACVLVASQLANAQEAWKLDRTKDGVTVHLKKIPGSKYKAYRGVMEIEATMGSVVSVFMDIDNMPQWMHEMQEAKVFQENDLKDRHLYMVNNAPFPIKDRDFIVRYRFQQNPENLAVKIAIENAQQLMPETKYTHMKIVDGYFAVEPAGEGRVKVTYECHLDPSGNVPSWAANIVISDTPFYTLKNLRDQVAKRGNQVVLPYVTELDESQLVDAIHRDGATKNLSLAR